MSTLSADVTQNGSIRNVDSSCSMAEIEEYDFSRLPDRPKNLNMEKQRSFDERSLIDMPLGLSPHLSSRAENPSRVIDQFDSIFMPGRMSGGFNTPRSQFRFEPHPMISEAWDSLRRTLVYFRGQPVGTIAALDSSEEKLNYDRVKTHLLIYIRQFSVAYVLNVVSFLLSAM
ncbi:hypothetical protein RJ639_021463 [Escallonia herrerae]|uniref:Uncharacterized protein n=1 Tax=Escallonia herrerae TaxID=1293975 RepID=A0AA88V3F6_9ASTE|nr:hypothetical protein RJ639_021463 [Escallonia herrerae]